jgi:hypothetical protein
MQGDISFFCPFCMHARKAHGKAVNEALFFPSPNHLALHARRRLSSAVLQRRVVFFVAEATWIAPQKLRGGWSGGEDDRSPGKSRYVQLTSPSH